GEWLVRESQEEVSSFEFQVSSSYLVGAFRGPRCPRVRFAGYLAKSGKISRKGLMLASSSSVNGGESAASQSSWAISGGFLRFGMSYRFLPLVPFTHSSHSPKPFICSSRWVSGNVAST